MTFETPVNLGQLRTALRERCQLDANDPRASNAVLNRLINAAMHRYQIANANGWPWDFQEVSAALSANQETLVFAVGGTNTPTKVRYVILQHTSGLWEYPLQRVSRYEQLEAYPNDAETGAPRVFSLMGDIATTGGFPELLIRFRPKCDIAYNVVIGMESPLDDLVNDADPDPATSDRAIDVWSSSVLSYAAYLVYRAREDLAEAMLGAVEDFDASVLQQRRTGRARLGAGIPLRPLADDRELN